MAYKTFVWVGGVTSTTSVDRFNFNYAGNWKERKKTSQPWPDTGSLYRYYATNEIPGPGDYALVAPYPGAALAGEFEVYSPLLFGGFTGNIHGGTYAGATVNSGISAFGTTWSSSLLSFEIGTDLYYYNTDLPTNTGVTFGLRYPFPIVGGGITLSIVETLKACKIEGMTAGAWDAILSARTSAQESGLTIKADRYIVGTSIKSNGAQTVWNSGVTGYSFSSYGIPGLTSGNALWIKLKVIDNYGYAPYTVNYSEAQKQNARVINTTFTGSLYNTNLNINDGFFLDFSPLMSTNDRNGYPLGGNVSGVVINFDNCMFESFQPRMFGINNMTFNKCTFGTRSYLEQRWTLNPATFGVTLYNSQIKIEGAVDPDAVYSRRYGGGYTGTTLPAYFNLVTIDNWSKIPSKGLPTFILGAGFTAAKENTTISYYYSGLFGGSVGTFTSELWIEPGATIAKMRLGAQYNSINKARLMVSKNSLLSNLKINMFEITIESGGILDLAHTQPDTWRFGRIQGITLSGGIKFYGGELIGAPDARLLNYTVKAGVNKRTNEPQLINSSPIQEGTIAER